MEIWGDARIGYIRNVFTFSIRLGNGSNYESNPYTIIKEREVLGGEPQRMTNLFLNGIVKAGVEEFTKVKILRLIESGEIDPEGEAAWTNTWEYNPTLGDRIRFNPSQIRPIVL